MLSELLDVEANPVVDLSKLRELCRYGVLIYATSFSSQLTVVQVFLMNQHGFDPEFGGKFENWSSFAHTSYCSGYYLQLYHQCMHHVKVDYLSKGNHIM